MRFGCCTSLENLEAVERAGYDYIELSLRPALMPEADESEFEPVRERIAASPLNAEAFAGFLGAEHRVVGDHIDRERLSKYVETAARRAKELGGEVIVFGSSGARNVPEGFLPEKAEDQIVAFLTMAGDHAERYGITIAIEPICARESNIIHTVREGWTSAKRVNHPSIRVLADLYHVWQEGEDLADLAEVGDWLVHVHIAEPVQRRYPGNDDFDFLAFFEALRSAGYDGRISCECRFDDFERDARVALETLRKYV